jgi:hypothetical protein
MDSVLAGQDNFFFSRKKMPSKIISLFNSRILSGEHRTYGTYEQMGKWISRHTVKRNIFPYKDKELEFLNSGNEIARRWLYNVSPGQ